jgi:hypothetical protein
MEINTMKQLLVTFIILIFGSSCVGQNRMLNNENMMGFGGGIIGGVGSALLTKNMSGTNKALIIAGSTLGSYWLASKFGKAIDDRDKKYNKQLIQKVLNENKDFETGEIKYSKFIENTNTGQKQKTQVTQSVTPTQTYNYRKPDIAPLNNQYGNFGIPPKYNMNQRVASNSTCRDITVDFKIEGLTKDPQSQQFYSFCRDPETGWRKIN